MAHTPEYYAAVARLTDHSKYSGPWWLGQELKDHVLYHEENGRHEVAQRFAASAAWLRGA